MDINIFIHVFISKLKGQMLSYWALLKIIMNINYQQNLNKMCALYFEVEQLLDRNTPDILDNKA